MAVLDTLNRARTLAYMLRNVAWISLTKPDILAAINAIDDFLETNTTPINNAFPITFRTNATPSQKALIVAYVAMRRSGILKVTEDG